MVDLKALSPILDVVGTLAAACAKPPLAAKPEKAFEGPDVLANGDAEFEGTGVPKGDAVLFCAPIPDGLPKAVPEAATEVDAEGVAHGDGLCPRPPELPNAGAWDDGTTTAGDEVNPD